MTNDIEKAKNIVTKALDDELKRLEEFDQSGLCPECKVPAECGYGLAGGGIGPYMYCPNCFMILSKSQDLGD